MKTIYARNVNEALPFGIDLLRREGHDEPSRAGPVRVLPYPVTTVYERPTERVLFWPARDANPFFHLFEAIWMLGGRRDLAFPKRFNRRFDEFSDDGYILHGAYGYRWREAFGMDQLSTIIYHLKKEPNSRRAVLQMWSAASDLGTTHRDLPCNTTIYFRRRNKVLDMTVCCRSNDIIWGAYGANAVHMSMLHEYMASAIGVPVGTYYQISNDYHAYYLVYGPLLERVEEMVANHYVAGMEPFPLLSEGENETKDAFDLDCLLFLDSPSAYGYRTKFFNRVVQPMFSAWTCYEKRNYDMALETMRQVAADDWGIAGTEWLARRAAKTRVKKKEQEEMKI